MTDQERIEAAFMGAVYRASRRARLQTVGREPIPQPSAQDIALYERARKPQLTVLR